MVKYSYMKFTKRGFLLIVIVLAAATFKSSVASAAVPSTAFRLTTSPTSINVSGAPGSTITTEIRVKNDGAASERIKTTLMKFSASGEEGKPALLDRTPADEYFDWVSFSPSVFDVSPNEWITVKMTIVLPKSAAFGYYYAPTFSRESAPKASSKSNVLLGSVAVLVLVEAKVPGAQRVAALLSFKTVKKSYEYLPASFAIKVRNTGNVHVVPGGDVIIRRGNKEIGRIPVNSAHGNVLPQSNRIFTATWNDGYPYNVDKTVNGSTVRDKQGTVEQTLSWNTDKITRLRFGKYTAQLLMVYDDGKRDVPLEAYVSFWVIPWRLIGAALLVIIIPAGGVYGVMRWRINKLRKVTKRV